MRAAAPPIPSRKNKRNQEAILRLLNEMGDLADGDLTIRAKVTEGHHRRHRRFDELHHRRVARPGNGVNNAPTRCR